MSALKVLMVASEAAPFAMTGGLADVMGALPAKLHDAGIDCRVILPLYKKIKENYGDRLEFVRWTMQNMGWRSMYSGLLKLEEKGLTYYFIDNEFYFNHDQIYLEYSFDIERFAFFQRAVLECLGDPMGFEPDIIHCHDWQAGMIPALLHAHYFPNGYHQHVKTVFTIHNLRYQGIHGVERIADLCDLGSDFMNEYGVLKDGVPNFMKAGIVYSDLVTTVSPTYAGEIMNDFYGEGLDGVLRNYAYKVSGILNGIDVASFNPATDGELVSHYDVTNWKEGKKANKRALREELGLSCPEDWPMLAMITRLVDQKGLDLLIRILDELLDYNVQFVLVGTGEDYYEKVLSEIAWRRPDRFHASIAFNKTLARRVYAAADIFLMPSLFEPCGLSQMCAMRYGTVPLVRETGGLKDTVVPYNQYTGAGNGFSFSNINAHELLFTAKRAVDLYWDSPQAWEALVRNGMLGDYSWDRSAAAYVKLYCRLLERPEGDVLPQPETAAASPTPRAEPVKEPAAGPAKKPAARPKAKASAKTTAGSRASARSKAAGSKAAGSKAAKQAGPEPGSSRSHQARTGARKPRGVAKHSRSAGTEKGEASAN